MYDYIMAGEYYSYLESKIENEHRLATSLYKSGIINEAAANKIGVFSEATAQAIADKWQKFIQFCQNLFNKFRNAITTLVNRQYLKANEDIIKNKQGNANIDYGYTGNYPEAIKRINNTPVPKFEQKYMDPLKADGDADLINAVMNGKNFKYIDNGDPLAQQLKDYFLCTSEGRKTGKFSELNFGDMYEYCYNFKSVNDVIQKDFNNIKNSANDIKALATEDKGNNTGTNAAAGGTTPQGGNTTGNTTAQNSSALYYMEAEGDNDQGQNNNGGNQNTGGDNKNVGNGKTGLEITNNNQDNNNNGNNQNGQNGNNNNKKTTDYAGKWIKVCNPIYTAKLTAAQQIARDYMNLIRTHVRSYGGQDVPNNNNNANAENNG